MGVADAGGAPQLNGRSVPIRMILKLWSPNSPFGLENSMFSGHEAASLCRRGKARAVNLADAMASIAGRPIEPARARAKFIKMGMPKKNGDIVLVFQSEFCEAMVRVAMEEAQYAADCAGYDKMVDASRSGDERQGIAVWANRPSGVSAVKVKQMSIRFKPREKKV